MKNFTYLDHTADIKFKAKGRTLEQTFTSAALALIHSICHDTIKRKKEISIYIEGKDLENLLYNFLEEIIFYFDSEHFILSTISKIKIDKKNLTLKATLKGDEAKHYELHSAIKSVTYHDMHVKKQKEGWVAQVVLDI